MILIVGNYQENKEQNCTEKKYNILNEKD